MPKQVGSCRCFLERETNLFILCCLCFICILSAPPFFQTKKAGRPIFKKLEGRAAVFSRLFLKLNRWF